MKNILKEFKTFALRGSVIDLAVGIIIGAAFNSIVQSLVNDVIMPPIGYFTGNVDFSNLYINLSNESFESLSAAKEAGVATINYGLFINSVISFVIVASVVFFLVRSINRLREKQEQSPQKTKTTRPCPYCLQDVSRKATRCQFCTSSISSDSK